jgi:hypothetical protein
MFGFLASWGFTDAVWPVVAGVVVVIALWRQKPASVIARLVGGLAAGLAVAVVSSPHDPLTGQVFLSDAVHLVVALLVGLGFIGVMFNVHGHN